VVYSKEREGWDVQQGESRMRRTIEKSTMWCTVGKKLYVVSSKENMGCKVCNREEDVVYSKERVECGVQPGKSRMWCTARKK
jgi:hypothetical protein